MIPGIGELNARRKLRAAIRRRAKALDAALDRIYEAEQALWDSRQAAGELLKLFAPGDRTTVPGAILRALAEEDSIPGDSEIYRARGDAHELERLLAGES